MEKVTNFYEKTFQSAFRAYFSEIGIQLKPDTDVWDEIARSTCDEGMVCLAEKQNGEIAGFIMFQEDMMANKSGFFSQRLCFIRELWVAPAYRGQGIGRALVAQAEESVEGVGRAILTNDPAAAGFYEKLGYTVDGTVAAKNGERVMVKNLG